MNRINPQWRHRLVKGAATVAAGTAVVLAWGTSPELQRLVHDLPAPAWMFLGTLVNPGEIKKRVAVLWDAHQTDEDHHALITGSKPHV